MKRWKRVMSLALCLTLAAAFSGCARETEPEPSPSPSASAAPTPTPEPRGPYTVAVVQWTEDPTLDAAREAFAARLEEWGVTPDRAAVEVRQAQGKAAEADRVCRELAEAETDLIVALGDPAAQAATSAAGDSGAAVLFLGSSTLAEDLGIRYPDSPEGNATGITAAGYEESQLALVLQAAPGLKTLGILVREDDSLCRPSVEKLQKLCEEKGLTARRISVPESGEPDPAAVAEIQAAITPDGGLTAGQCAAVGKALFAAKKPWVAGSAAPVRAGALGCVTVPAEERGRLLADRAVELMAGRPVSQLPVTAPDSREILLNQAVLDGLHVKLAQETLDAADFISAAPAA